MAEELALGPATTLTVVSCTPQQLELRASYAPAGSPPPAHFHPEQDERFEVLSGSMCVRLDGQERVIEAGDTLDVPRGAVHQMWNDADAEAVLRWCTLPAGRTLGWFREVAALAAGDETVDGGTLLERYADTFRLAGD